MNTDARRAEVAEERLALAERCRRELDGVIDELGLAAVFESWGITDLKADSRYGAADVFQLASEIIASADLGLVVDDPRDSVPPTTLERSWLMRAATYVPPTVFVAIALSNAAVPASGALFAVITCVGWGMAEALSRISYSSMHRGGTGAVRDLNLRVLGFGTVGVFAVSAAVGVIFGSVGAGLLIAAQLQYLLLSIVLLPIEQESLLLWWIVPTMLCAALLVTDLEYLWVVLLVAVVCELGASLHALVILGRVRPCEYGSPRREDYRSAAPFLASGAAMGGFVLSATAVALLMLGSRTALLVMVLPLMLSMGAAEIGIRLFQVAVFRELTWTTDLGLFARRVRWMVLRFCAGYLLVLTLVDVLIAAVAGVEVASGRSVGYLLLGLVGLCLFLTLILMSMDHVLPVLATFGTGMVVIGGSVILWGASAPVITAAVLFTVVAAGVLLLAALIVVGHPVNHVFV